MESIIALLVVFSNFYNHMKYILTYSIFFCVGRGVWATLSNASKHILIIPLICLGVTELPYKTNRQHIGVHILDYMGFLSVWFISLHGTGEQDKFFQTCPR